jgi:hypothetical protein
MSYNAVDGCGSRFGMDDGIDVTEMVAGGVARGVSAHSADARLG